MATLHTGDRGARVKKLQVAVNKILVARDFGFRRIKADEILGDDTIKAARLGAWLIGLSHGDLKRIEGGAVTDRTFAFLVRAEPATSHMKERSRERRPMARKLIHLHRRRARKPAARGVATFDGVPVASWMVKWLKKSRDAGWQGQLVSGFRSPEHSEAVCRAICGQPSCPGRCAGRASRHVGLIFPAGAIDVSFSSQFGEIQRKIGSPLRNDLPNDPVHFSTTGH